MRPSITHPEQQYHGDVSPARPEMSEDFRAVSINIYIWTVVNKGAGEVSRHSGRQAGKMCVSEVAVL